MRLGFWVFLRRIEMASKKVKMWCGNPPEEQMWAKVCDLGKFDGIGWVMYSKVPDVDSPWQSYKLVADGVVPGKANYRLSWNGERFALHPHLVSLQEFRPALARAVNRALDKAVA
jgi:hypothetical protein